MTTYAQWTEQDGQAAAVPAILARIAFVGGQWGAVDDGSEPVAGIVTRENGVLVIDDAHATGGLPVMVIGGRTVGALESEGS